MCEYCEKLIDNQFKSLVNNRLIDSSLFIDGAQGRIFWRIDGFNEGTLVAYAKIKYCPMCRRKFKEKHK